MNSVLEIERALRQLPAQKRREIARWLLEDLQDGALSQTEDKGSGDNGGEVPPLPDYSARRTWFCSLVKKNAVENLR